MNKNFIIIFIIFSFLFGGLFLFKETSFLFYKPIIENFDKKNISQNKKPLPHVFPKKQRQEQDFSLSLVMVGDNLIHGTIYKDAYKNNHYDFTPIYQPIKYLIGKYDLAYYNQESIIGGKDFGYSSYPRFNSPYEVGDAMIDTGFNIVSLANNHTLDKGEQGIFNTLEYWKTKPVLISGAYSTQGERNTIFIREKNNIRYGMLSYTYGTNGLPLPKGKDYLVNIWPVDSKNHYEAYKEQVKKDVELIRDKVDVLLVAMHWGLEYHHEPSWWQKDQAQYLSSLGVDIVIGTHPHVIQPITFINDTLVIYSLGNFLSAQTNDNNYARRIGLMASVGIHKHIDKSGTSKTSLFNVSNQFVFTSHQKYKNFQVIPFSQVTEKELPNKDALFQKYKNIVQKYNKDIDVR